MRWNIAIVAALSWCGLALAGVPEPDGYRQDDYRAPVPDTVSGGRVLHAAGLKAAIDKGGIVLIDVLPAPRRPDNLPPTALWRPVPRQDIPGSTWLPDVGRGALSPELERWFQAELARLTGGDKTKPVAFYCLAQCWMSWNATKRAASYGYTNVAWYPDGTDGWMAAGLPLAEAKPESMPQ